MSKRTMFTVITPLPRHMTRDAALACLHHHPSMLELNPLIIRHEQITPPPNAPEDERRCAWWLITDRINYLPGVKGEVSYKAAFLDLPNGLQTHVYAPAGLHIRGKWSIGGSGPGEPREPFELGLKVPRDRLYLREDVDMRCNVLMAGFVKRNLCKAHQDVVKSIVAKATPKKDVYTSSNHPAVPHKRNNSHLPGSAHATSASSKPATNALSNSSRNSQSLPHSQPFACTCHGEHDLACPLNQPAYIDVYPSESPVDLNKALPRVPEEAQDRLRSPSPESRVVSLISEDGNGNFVELSQHDIISDEEIRAYRTSQYDDFARDQAQRGRQHKSNSNSRTDPSVNGVYAEDIPYIPSPIIDLSTEERTYLSGSSRQFSFDRDGSEMLESRR